jgi:hypothetical protein
VDGDGRQLVRHGYGHGGVPVTKDGQSFSIGPVDRIENLVGIQLEAFDSP